MFPNGTAVTRILDISNDSDTDLLYSIGDTGALRLHRRGSVSGPTGSYCCVIPDNTGVDVTFCVQLGKWVSVLIHLYISVTDVTDHACTSYSNLPTGPGDTDSTEGVVAGVVIVLAAVIVVGIIVGVYFWR